MTEPKVAASLTRPCVKCRVQEATLDSRSQPVCRDCFVKFIATKCIKQIGILGKETRPAPSTTGGPPTATRRYLLGLSFGVSSTVLLHLLNENVEFQLAKGRNAPFDLVVIHIDASSFPDGDQPSEAAERTLDRYRARYPRFTFHCVPLSSAQNYSVDSGPEPPPATTTPAIPATAAAAATTPASRADIRRHLTRRALLAHARRRGCQALLLGHSTTALAELTLAEAAKGRGFALPWLINDGPAPAPGLAGGGTPSPAHPGSGGVFQGDTDQPGGPPAPPLLVHHPLRDALRKELAEYAGLVEPPLSGLLGEDEVDGSRGGPTAKRAPVVSHRDLSIEEVMTRYFAEVEASYPSVVANVARTTGKLVRAGEQAGASASAASSSPGQCGLCEMPLDEDGDARWRGELGIPGAGPASRLGMRLCYGCERSTAG